MKILVKIKKCLILVIIHLSQNIMRLVVGKMKNETAGVAIREFVGLKPRMCSFLVDDSSDHRKAKGVKKNVVARISHNECKYVLLNSKCLK